MKKFKLNVQRHICILLCFILYITVLPLPVSAEEAKSKTVRVGWYEGTYNTTGADGQPYPSVRAECLSTPAAFAGKARRGN